MDLMTKAKYRAISAKPYQKRKDDAEIFSGVASLREFRRAESIFCYVSVPGETDTRALIAHALTAGKTVSVPLTLPGGEMIPKVIRSFSELRPGRFGLPEPGAAAPEPERIDLAIVPCLCADRAGYRVGRGGGYYDRFLADFKGKSVLLCPSSQLYDKVPREPHDKRCGIVVTETEIIRIKK